jgi:hypothetical protein
MMGICKKVFVLISLIMIMFAFSNPVSASTILTLSGATYYLSATGSDSNNGLTSDKSWLSPNHALNCGDTILASPGSYNAGNFGSGKWGMVTCPSNNNVAWVKCATFDTCKIVTAGNDGMRIGSSYWGVQGWEVTNTAGACFSVTPPGFSNQLSHIIFANNIANGCKSNGFNSYPYYSGSNQASVDYIEIIGNLVYNAAGGNSECFSGISVYEPKNSDTNPGTHIYIGQNISWSNVDGSSCPGNSDGEGIILDDWNGDQSSMSPPYSGQGAVENNILLGNGSAGIEPYHNSLSSVLIRNNTAYGNYTDPVHAGTYNGELLLSRSNNVTFQYNIAQATTGSVAGSGYAVYGFYTGLSNNTDVVDYNWIDGLGGKNTGINSSSGFAYGAHQTLGVNPLFANPAIPGAPVCGGALNTLDCMKNTIAGFVPGAAGIGGYGYQAINNNYTQNDYYPAWLCNVTMPDGIISNYCAGVVNTPVPTNTLLVPTSTFTPIPTDTFAPTPTNIVTPIPTRTPECKTVIFTDGLKIIVCEP